LIEIGKEWPLAHGARRTASLFWTLGSILVLVWLVRGFLAVSQYSEALLITALAFGFLARAFRTNLSRGVTRAVSSFLGEMALASIFTIIVIWFLGWVASLQADSLPGVFASKVPSLAITALFGIASFIVGTASPRTRALTASGPALLMTQNSTTDMGETKLSVKSASIGLPVRKSRRTVGCVVTGDLNAVFETPMGTVNATIAGPVTTFGVPFRGEKASVAQVEKVTGKKLNELIQQTQVETSNMPLTHFRRDQSQESGDLPLSDVESQVDSPCSRLMQRLGAFSRDLDEDSEKWDGRQQWRRRGKLSSWWSLEGERDQSYISSTGDGVRAKWNGSTLDFRKGMMKLRVGSDGFTYSPRELETYTPLHTLSVTQDKVTLNTKRFTLDVIGTRVILRAEDGSKSTDSAQLARDLRALLADTAKKQISDVLEEQPIDLGEMISTTEEVLAKHG